MENAKNAKNITPPPTVLLLTTCTSDAQRVAGLLAATHEPYTSALGGTVLGGAALDRAALGGRWGEPLTEGLTESLAASLTESLTASLTEEECVVLDVRLAAMNRAALVRWVQRTYPDAVLVLCASRWMDVAFEDVMDNVVMRLVPRVL